MRKRTISLATLLIAFLALLGGEDAGLRRAPAHGAAPADGADALAALNIASRAAYRSAKEEALAHFGPVVLLEGDDLVLKNGGQRTVVAITPEVYTALKAVSHVPLAVHALLGGKGDGPLSEGRVDRVL